MRPSPMFYREQQRQRELAEYAHLSEEVQRGVRILLDLTTTLHSGTTAPFMERVDAVRDGAPDYYQVFFFCFLCPFSRLSDGFPNWWVATPTAGSFDPTLFPDPPPFEAETGVP